MIKRDKTRLSAWICVLILFLLLLVLLWMDINAGYRKIEPGQIGELLLGQGEPGLRYTLFHLRLPRVFTSMLVGMGLAGSGAILQGVSRNPMAEPGILGINAGGGLFLALFLVFFSGKAEGYSYLLPILAFGGSVTIAVLDFRLARTRRGLSPRRLLLVGVAVSMGVSSLSSILMLGMSDSEYAFVQSWISGSIWGADWENLKILAPVMFLLLVLSMGKSRTLNVLALGEQTATGLGVRVSRQNLLLLGTAVAMSSLCCAVGGGLSFVGLVCPHLSRKLVGQDFRVLLPASLLTGGCLMAVSDMISRSLLPPHEIPIGIVAAVMGAPYFIYLLMKE